MLWLLLLACARPDPCADMCLEAEALYGACLGDWGASWSDAGYADGDDFIDACETWAWEMRRLERAGGDRGWTDETCAVREARFAQGTCSDFTETDWNQMPWTTP